jgi:hypothetical protein
MKENKVFFYGSYQGSPKCQANIDGVEYVIEIDSLEQVLMDMIDSKGFTTSKTNRQKYPRLIINK